MTNLSEIYENGPASIYLIVIVLISSLLIVYVLMNVIIETDHIMYEYRGIWNDTTGTYNTPTFPYIGQSYKCVNQTR